MRNQLVSALAFVLSLAGSANASAAAPGPAVRDAWEPLSATSTGGVLGERLKAWRDVRLWRVIRDPFVLKGFESPPGEHPWQGEHVGKWLHAATLAYESTRDARLLEALRETARRLVASRQQNGYIGTYAPGFRFFEPPGKHTRSSWDVWTARYVLYGLLAYEQFHPDPSVVEACTRLGELLLQTYGAGGADLTTVGTRHGMSSTVLLESVVMLYERTGDRRFLDLANRIHGVTEANPQLRLVTALTSGTDVSVPGDGKAYQLLSTLLGYARLHRHSGEASYLRALESAWRNIRDGHTYTTGGPWTYKSDSVRNHECFVPTGYFHPANLVETCSTTTWVQVSLELLKLTGKAQYGEEAERAILNHLIGAQSPRGREWAYFTAANTAKREYNDVIHCCGSSGPRALEEYARHLAGAAGEALSINSYLPFTARVASARILVSSIVMEGNYPFADRATMRLEMEKPARFSVDFRLPAGASDLWVTIGGVKQELTKTPSGFLRLARAWKGGESVELRFQFRLRAAIHNARDGRDWVAFSRGPLALAQGGASKSDDSEIARLATQDGGAWLEPAAGSADAAPRFRIKGTPFLLMPYYQAGSDGSSVRTYFPLAKPR